MALQAVSQVPILDCGRGGVACSPKWRKIHAHRVLAKLRAWATTNADQDMKAVGVRRANIATFRSNQDADAARMTDFGYYVSPILTIFSCAAGYLAC